jgi:flagellar basal-body rod modification protein FlgD
MATVSTINTTSKPLPDATTRMPVQTLGQEDFLKLLVTQMSQQDPMSPMKDNEFIAQMAQFSSLEQSKTMQQDMASLRANTLLGSTVTVEDANSATGYTTGVVDGILMNGKTPELIIKGARYELSAVNTIESTPAASTSNDSGTAATSN